MRAPRDLWGPAFWALASCLCCFTVCTVRATFAVVVCVALAAVCADVFHVCAALAAYFAAFADPFDAFSCVAAVCCSLLLFVLRYCHVCFSAFCCFAAVFFLVHRQLNPTLAASDLPKCQEQFFNCSDPLTSENAKNKFLYPQKIILYPKKIILYPKKSHPEGWCWASKLDVWIQVVILRKFVI